MTFVTLGSRVDGDKNPVWFTLGLKEVLQGWDKGLKDMCTGERRKLTVPPSLAYGKAGKGNVQKDEYCKDCNNGAPILVFYHEILLPIGSFRQDPSRQYPHF